MSAQTTISLLPKQRAFVDSIATHPAYWGGVGAGKSIALCLKALILSEMFPGNLGMILRKDYPSLRDTTMKTFFGLRPDLRNNYVKSEEKVILPNKSEILFRHAERLHLGHELGFYGIDQAEEIPEEVFLALSGRLRRQNVSVRQGFVVGNPAGHNWCWRRWKAHKDVKKDDYPCWESPTGDNPFLPEGYLENLTSSNPEEWVRRYVHGSWDDYEGLIWPDFNVSRHVIEPYEIPLAWDRYRSMDFGYRNPTCVLFAAEDQDGNLVIYDEHYKNGWLLQQHADEIKRRSGQHDFLVTYIDPSCGNRNREKDGHLVSVIDEMADFGIYCTPANNDVTAGINRVGEYFKQGRIKIFKGCENLIWELQDYRWHQISVAQSEKTQTPEKPRKVDDHACVWEHTRVLTADGWQRISSIDVGDEVQTRKGLRKVLASERTGTKDIIAVSASPWGESYYRNTVWCTRDHPIWIVGRGWVPAGELKVGDMLELTHGGEAEIADIVDFMKDAEVWNLTVDDAHEYYANGVLVSNCDALRYLTISRTWHVPRNEYSQPQDIASRGVSGYGI